MPPWLPRSWAQSRYSLPSSSSPSNLSPTPLGVATWAAAILAAIAVALIGWPAQGAKPSLVGLGFALATAAGFGLVDALVPHFSHLSDPLTLSLACLPPLACSLSFLSPCPKASSLPFEGRADRWMWASCFPMGAQAVLMSLAIGFHHVPTEAKRVLLLPGLWAILLVAWLGKKMGLEEGTTPKGHASQGDCSELVFCLPAYTWPLWGHLDRHGHFVFANRKNFHLIISHENHFLPHFVANLPWLHCLDRSPIQNQSRQGPGVRH